MTPDKKNDEGWSLEIVDQLGGSTVWDDIFVSDLDALEELQRTIAEEGMGSFLRGSSKLD